MSKRTILSGSRKKKKIKAQKEITELLLKLTSFFTVEESDKLIDHPFSSQQDNSTSECNENELKTASLENESVSPGPGTHCHDILPEKLRGTWI